MWGWVDAALQFLTAYQAELWPAADYTCLDICAQIWVHYSARTSTRQTCANVVSARVQSCTHVHACQSVSASVFVHAVHMLAYVYLCSIRVLNESVV